MTLNRNTFIVPITALAVALLFAGSASAQGRGQGRGSRERPAASGQSGRAMPRAQTRSAPSQAPRVQPRVAPQRTAPERNAPQRSAPQRVQPDRRYSSGISPRGGAVPRYSTLPRYSTRIPRYDNRGYSAPRYVAPRYGAPRYSTPRYVAPYRYAGRPLYRASSPYYAFRPRLRLSFGLYVGYPVAFPSWYDPYAPGVYPAYRSGISYGGLSLDIQPYDAAIYVDGEYVGVVNDFSPLQPPLTLPAGPHHIDVDSPGFAPLSFDITVVPGQVIPYQGTLAR